MCLQALPPPSPPSAVELAALKQMILSSYTAEGQLVIDSVSLYTLGNVLGKGEHFIAKLVLNKHYLIVIIPRGETDGKASW